MTSDMIAGMGWGLFAGFLLGTAFAMYRTHEMLRTLMVGIVSMLEAADDEEEPKPKPEAKP